MGRETRKGKKNSSVTWEWVDIVGGDKRTMVRTTSEFKPPGKVIM